MRDEGSTPLAASVSDALESVVPALVASGAAAVLLVGSHARGDARPEADIDLIVIGEGPDYALQRVGEQLISVSWRTAAALRREMLTPPTCAGAVPALRAARVLHDPYSTAATMQAEARAWTWEGVGDTALDAWVADAITGFAEEVHKLVGATRVGDVRKQTIQRTILALRLAVPLTIHFRLLYDSEHQLWSLVDARMGAHWTRVQAIAFGEDQQDCAISVDPQAAAAGEMFVLACAAVERAMDAMQRAVVTHAIQLLDDAGLRLPPG